MSYYQPSSSAQAPTLAMMGGYGGAPTHASGAQHHAGGGASGGQYHGIGLYVYHLPPTCNESVLYVSLPSSVSASTQFVLLVVEPIAVLC
jgi:hypothetical protein